MVPSSSQPAVILGACEIAAPGQRCRVRASKEDCDSKQAAEGTFSEGGARQPLHTTETNTNQRRAHAQQCAQHFHTNPAWHPVTPPNLWIARSVFPVPLSTIARPQKRSKARPRTYAEARRYLKPLALIWACREFSEVYTEQNTVIVDDTLDVCGSNPHNFIQCTR